MLQLTPHHRLLLAVNPVDFRKGIDSLIALCQQYLNEDAYSGTIFVFTNKRRIAVKLLVYDGQGFWLCMKRFSQGQLKWWPKADTRTYTLNAQALQVLLYQGHPQRAAMSDDWKPVVAQ
ncbi:IS66 family insertion sequence element accessory protein TnpB [Zooshikella ganghwensis]|uniref:Transposase n=1 Tax=Zooshikella ganghwensis TaxID=202772 RepID=A0A4P9VEL4_9GAMM|nr:IS66 family insertion sequence element accessory protein TnpB [Zooshikella ganghwensis]RDH41495.1 transposase [Zooshikella ganghwensis]